MRYAVIIQRRAQKQIVRFPTSIQDRLERALKALAVDPRPPGNRRFQGREGWRIRVGDYRVIYEIDDES